MADSSAFARIGLILTLVVNVPMNEELATVVVPTDPEAARQVWDDYSGRWQLFNQLRTAFSGVALGLAAAGLFVLGRREPGERGR